MRTTLVIDDDVIREAKHRAADLGLSLSAFVNRLLKDALRPRAAAPEPPFEMVTYGSGSELPGLEPEAVDALLRAHDLESVLPE